MAAPETPAPQASAVRQLARGAFGLFVVACLAAVAGPVLEYRSDLHESDALLRLRVAHKAELYATVLDGYLHLVEGELTRLATRPELDPRDGRQTLELALLDFAHEDSVQFRSGLAVLDSAGEPLWSAPDGLFAGDDADADRRWMKRVLAGRTPTIATLGDNTRFVVAVPIVRGGVVAGAVAGIIDPEETGLPTLAREDRMGVVVLDDSGASLAPARPPPWATGPEALGELARLQGRRTGTSLSEPNEQYIAAVRPVGRTGLRIAAAADEDVATAASRRRFLGQLVVIATLQVLAVGLLALLFRRVTRRFVTMERAALESERLIALGTATSLIAHEVKNALHGLKAATGLIATGGDTSIPLRSIEGEVSRLSHLSTSLLLFGRTGAVHQREVDLARLVRETADAMRVLPESEEVQLALAAPASLGIRCDPHLVTTAVHNLLRNAMEATVSAKDSGRITTPEVRVEVRETPDGVQVQVDDNGGGLVPEVRDRLFHPFVSGKAAGIGLGLAMSRRVLEAHGGSLVHEPIPGGSRFIATLPRSVPAEERAS